MKDETPKRFFFNVDDSEIFKIQMQLNEKTETGRYYLIDEECRKKQ